MVLGEACALVRTRPSREVGFLAIQVISTLCADDSEQLLPPPDAEMFHKNAGREREQTCGPRRLDRCAQNNALLPAMQRPVISGLSGADGGSIRAFNIESNRSRT